MNEWSQTIRRNGRTLIPVSVDHDERGHPEAIDYREENGHSRTRVPWGVWLAWKSEYIGDQDLEADVDPSQGAD